MTTYKCRSLSELTTLLAKHDRKRRANVRKAVTKTARATRDHVAANTVPVAFDELRHSLHVEAKGDNTKVTADAPHAAAVEVGSRPHWVPLDALIKWVKLRGMQGLKSDKQLRKLPGTTTYRHAKSIAQQIRDRMMTDGSDATPINAPEDIARAIQAAIAKNGTAPHWYMKAGLPYTAAELDTQVRAALAAPLE